MNKHPRPRGFTLIELLVVIGVIGILMSMLLPALSRAREAANRTCCLANLHQIGVFLQQYQNQYDDQLPIYITPAYLDKAFYHGEINNYTNLGLLVPANIAPPSGSEAGRVFYCPGSSIRGTLRGFNHASNPWVGRPNSFTRITYSARPEYWVWDPTGLSRNIHFPNVRFDMDRQTDDDDAFLVSGSVPVFPRVRTLNRKAATALVTDLVDSDATNRRLIHRGGWNVLYANGSARLVPPSHFAKQLTNLERLERDRPNTPAVRRAWFDLWQQLDRF